MTLGEYLREAAGKPWVWGVHDCCTFAADWTIACGRPDPMTFIRGSYSTERGALRHIRVGGGLADLWSRGMLDAGVAEAGYVNVGDVGIIVRPTECGSDEACGIWTGERWVSLGVRGLVAGPAEIVRAWRL